MDFCCEEKMGYLLLRLFGRKPFRLCLMFSVFFNSDRAISVDSRLLALLLGLRYKQIVTLKRTCINAFGFWILSIVGSSSYSLIIKPKVALRQFNMSGRID